MTDILRIARETIAQEIEALQAAHDHLDGQMELVVEHILQCQGRVVVTGIGKSAIIAQKIVATMNSTGTAALYMHAADAIHGDLGMILRNDTILLISKSGETAEIKVLVPLIRRMGNTSISITSKKASYLAQQTDYHLYTPISKEADPNNLAPTASTSAQMAMGDALAVCLLARRGFTPERFASLHPGGSLGKKLYLTVNDLLRSASCPAVPIDADLKTVILTMTKGRVGATAVLDQGAVVGIITDGDLRRVMNTDLQLSTAIARDLYTKGGYQVSSDTMAVDALEVMQTHSINQLLVLDDDKQLVGVLHLHELIKEGLV